MMREGKIEWLDRDWTIRRATRGDQEVFVELWQEYLQENYKTGGPLLPNGNNLNAFLRFFTAYTSNKQPGIVLLAAKDNAVLMWGAAPSVFDSRYGRVAQGWGTYVRPEYRREGWSAKMRKVAMAELAPRFDTVIGSGALPNEAGIESGVKAGFRLFESVGALKLGG